MNCPHCKKQIEDALIVSEAGRINGRKTSEARTIASRENGKKGGRPKKEKGEKYDN